MTLPILEVSRDDAKPVELYKFTAETPPIGSVDAILFWTDALNYPDNISAEVGGWYTKESPVLSGTCPGPYALFTTSNLELRRGDGGGTGELRMAKRITGLAPGARAYAEFDYVADGHWFEPASLILESGDGVSRKTQGVNPPTGPGVSQGTKVTGIVTVQADGELIISMGTRCGYPAMPTIVQCDGNDNCYRRHCIDYYQFLNLKVWVLTEEEGNEPVVFPVTELNYARAEQSFTFLGDTYEPASFNRSGFRSGDGESIEEVELEVPRDHPVARLFEVGQAPAPVNVTVYHVHRQDAATAAETDVLDKFYVPFVGQVGKVRFENATCTLTLASLRALLSLKKPSMLVQEKCANFLYDRQCGLDREAHRADLVCESVDGFTMTITGLIAASSSGLDPTRFQYGFIIAPSGEHLFILEQAGDVVALLQPALTVAAGDKLTVYWGCDRTANICDFRFSNIRRHNGRPMVPKRNPFAGSGLND